MLIIKETSGQGKGNIQRGSNDKNRMNMRKHCHCHWVVSLREGLSLSFICFIWLLCVQKFYNQFHPLQVTEADHDFCFMLKKIKNLTQRICFETHPFSLIYFFKEFILLSAFTTDAFFRWLAKTYTNNPHNPHFIWPEAV